MIDKLTPMMKQYMEIKEQHKDCILFFRLGDFYEMFFEDAETAAAILEIALTGKSCGLEERAPMCGVPYHAADSYIAKLIQSGLKVAICEQMEDPSATKGIVRREVVRIISPGTVLDDSYLETKKSNYLMAIYRDEHSGDYGVSYVDITVGELRCTHIGEGELQDEIIKVQPSEIIYNCDTCASFFKKHPQLCIAYINENSREHFLNDEELLFKYFSRTHIEGKGLSEPVQKSLVGLLSYIGLTQNHIAANISSINLYSSNDYMKLDSFTRRNLELTQTIMGNSKKGSLLHILDKTRTSMGGRLLKKWVDEPLLSREQIDSRLELVCELYSDFSLREDIAAELKGIYDIERLCGKIAFEKINPKELVNLKLSLSKVPLIKRLLMSSSCTKLKELSEDVDELDDIRGIIEAAILDEPSYSSKDGNIIKSSYDPKVGELRELTQNGARLIRSIEEKEREATGIKSLKIGYNKVFGYYIDITKTNLRQTEVPEGYTRKQTLSNSERFITQELKLAEEKILTAQDKIKNLEYEIFVEIRNKIYQSIGRLQATARTMAQLDALNSLASVAYDNGYVKPELNLEGLLDIKNGRHPVIEKMIGHENFIPNDISQSRIKDINIITGPNMAGKSTYMRQTALICLMAHIGSFVPADEARIALLDRIYTRVGASDDLSQGQSTFMVEMSEVAHILSNATKDSLVVLDEIGRGTSTYDGLSLAWAIVDYIHSSIRCKTLFATHYHELTELEAELERVQNFSVAVKEDGEDVIFLRKIVPGGTDKSYGIHVAKLAKLPAEVIEKSSSILSSLEETKIAHNKKSIASSGNLRPAETEIKVNDAQLDMFSYKKDALLKELTDMDIMKMTPIDAMNCLYRIQNEARTLGDDTFE
ncbi:DNA mismatch repair protein MutS [Peptoclostridium acidaminophilum DSM 3953]|uniref:DNA mismatch repair protein MutS n=2 Tax=Peptoclostridium acidaminophilum TaxID=1731 RepID=W8TFI5_PEPAC|nr:DNA mismatch repair protein MutS [Peptoclostridium acidaminophilum]AHM56593.1 DNA mismatch repair protein MutS [Peptoclostridium acidaminophilum DSM 3953]